MLTSGVLRQLSPPVLYALVLSLSSERSRSGSSLMADSSW